MSIYNGPPRAGARGGRDQFSWDNVKSDKDREFYLGHSVKALAGRWQKNKDVYWYTREKGAEDASLQEELRAVKAREEEAMMEALGLKPKSAAPPPPPALDGKELAQLLKRRNSTEDETTAAAVAPAIGVTGLDDENIKGLGFTAQKAMGAVAAARSDSLTMELGGTMAGVGVQPGSSAGPSKAGPSQAAGLGQGLPGPPPLAGVAGMLALVRSGAKLSAAQLAALSESDRKAVKKARKEAKKAKKAAKKAAKKEKKQKKDKKHKARSDSSSDSSSSDDEGPAGKAGHARHEDNREGHREGAREQQGKGREWDAGKEPRELPRLRTDRERDVGRDGGRYERDDGREDRRYERDDRREDRRYERDDGRDGGRYDERGYGRGEYGRGDGGRHGRGEGIRQERDDGRRYGRGEDERHEERQYQREEDRPYERDEGLRSERHRSRSREGRASAQERGGHSPASPRYAGGTTRHSNGEGGNLRQSLQLVWSQEAAHDALLTGPPTTQAGHCQLLLAS